MSTIFEKGVAVVAMAIPVALAAIAAPHLAEINWNPVDAASRLFVQASGPAPNSTAQSVSAPKYAPLDAPPPPPLQAPTSVVDQSTQQPGATGPAGQSPAVLGTALVSGAGSAGGLLRAEPVTGAVVATLHDGMTLNILGHRLVNGADWFQVQAGANVGWVFGLMLTISPEARAALATQDAAAVASPQPAGVQQQHTVQVGEQLKDIAAEYGVSMQAILAANTIADPDSLHVGDVLTIPAPT